MTTEKKSQKRKFTGTVVSNKMNKTVVVLVESVKMHPMYKKQYTSSKKYKVHDENNIAKEGQTVTFEECRPFSKDKRWRLIEVKQ